MWQWWDYDATTVAAGKTLQASDDVKVYGDLNGEGDLTVKAGDALSCYVTVAGNLDIYTADGDTIYLWGDTLPPTILLDANTEFEGWYDQIVDAGGTLTANGYLKKLNWSWCDGWSDGSLYLHAVG